MSRQIQRLCAWGGSALACLLAACSGGSSPSQTDSSLAQVNPCSVLGASEIQSALGTVPTAEGKRENLGVTDKCSWDLSNGASLAVTFYNPSGAAALYAPSVSPRRPDDKSYESVGGLGDQAVYRDDSRPPIVTASEIVEVVKGKRHFDVQYVVVSVSPARPVPKDALLGLARTVLAHAS